jgi:hypothetical protein
MLVTNLPLDEPLDRSETSQRMAAKSQEVFTKPPEVREEERDIDLTQY